MYKTLTFPTREAFPTPGQRVTVTPKGVAILAPAGNAGIGHNLGNGAGGRVVVQLLGEAIRATVAANTPAGVLLYDADGGILSPANPRSESASGISLQPTGGSPASIYVLRNRRPAAAPSIDDEDEDDELDEDEDEEDPEELAGADDDDDDEDDDEEEEEEHALTPATLSPPAIAGPTVSPMPKTYADPVAEVLRKKAILVAAGESELRALELVFAGNPGLHSAYAAAVRADPAALARSRVNAQVAGGAKRIDAMAAVFRADPALQQAVIKSGQRPGTRREPAAPSACELEIRRRVDQLKATGLPHAEAVIRTFKERPDLHSQYLALHNKARA